MGQQFLDLEGTKILANKIKEGERKVVFVGSENPDTNGWYKVASQTCSGYGDTNITFMVTSTYGNYHSGILQLQIRSDSNSIWCPVFKWLSRIDFDINNFIIVINGMTWTLYAYQPITRYGRICFEILSRSSITAKDMAWTLNFKDNYTKESTTPNATVKSSDGATVNHANTTSKLQTARTINGVSFDGTKDITITDNTKVPNTGGNIKGKILISELDTFKDQAPSITLAIGDNDTGFKAPSDGNTEYWSDNVKQYNMKDVYHTGRKPTPNEIGASPSNHNHDDRYYTESEINSKLNDKVNGKNRIITNSNISVLGLTFPVTCETLANAMRDGDVLFCNSNIISDAPTSFGQLFVMREDENRIEFQYRSCNTDANKNTLNDLYIASYRRLSESKKFSGWTLIGGDSGWIKLPLNSGIQAYSSNETPQYRKCANVVNLVGAIKGANGMNSYDWLAIGTLPVGYRPSITTYTMCHGSGVGSWLMRISTDGVVQAGRYTENGSSYKPSMDNTEWLTLSATFLTR